MSDRLLTLILGADNRRLRRDFRKATQEAQTFARNAGEKIRSGFSLSLGSLATLGTGAGLAAVGQDVLDMNETLTRMGIQAKLSKEELQAHEETIKQMGVTYGLGKRAVLEATAQIVDLQGPSALTAENIQMMATALTATGGQSEDIAKVASALFDAGVKGAEAEQSISAFIEAGDQGSIPFAKMGTVLAGLIPQYKSVTQEGKRGAAEIGAMLQVMGKVTAGNQGEAATLMKSMMTALSRSRERLSKEGFKAFYDKDGAVRDIQDTLPLFEKLAKHKDLNELVGSSIAATAVQAMATYAEDYVKIVGIAAESNAVQVNSMKYMNSEAGRMNKAMAEIRANVESLFTAERIETFTRGSEFAADAVGHVVDNLDRVLLLLGAIKAMQFGRMVTDWSGSLSKLIGDSTTATTRIGGLGAGVAKATGALGGVATAAGVLTGAFSATALALEAAGYERWLDKVFSSGSKTSDQENKRLRDKYRKQEAMSLEGIRAVAQTPARAYGGAEDVRLAQESALRLQALLDQGIALDDVARRLPDDYQRVAFAADKYHGGGVLHGDRLEEYQNQRPIYERAVARDEAVARNKKTLAGVHHEKLAPWLNQLLAKDDDGRITMEEIAREARERFFWTPVRQQGQTAEQAKDYAEAKTQEIAQKIWTFAQQQAREYGDKYKVGNTVIEVHLDGNKVAEATDNALNRRRSEAE